MKNILSGIGLLGAMSGAAYFALTGEGERSFDPNTIRPARLERHCPDPEVEPDIAAKCDKGMIDENDHCLCMTTESKKLDNEIEKHSDLKEKHKKRLVVCESGGQIVSTWEKDNGSINVNCVLAAQPLIDISIGIETDLVTQLRAACSPCPVYPKEWGVCPYCLHPSTPSCADMCPTSE